MTPLLRGFKVRKGSETVKAMQYDGTEGSLNKIGAWCGDDESGDPWIAWITEDRQGPYDAMCGQRPLSDEDFVVRVGHAYFPVDADVFMAIYSPQLQRNRRNRRQFFSYRVRRCLSMHECAICEKTISLGQQYYDGGYGRRAHLGCVNETNAEAKVAVREA